MDPDKQDRQIKDFIAKKVSAIIISPCNAHAVGASIKSANQAGIPVFMADTAIAMAFTGDSGVAEEAGRW